MKALSMTTKARNARRFVPWWCSESPTRAYGGVLLDIASRYLREGTGGAKWQCDIMVLHVARQQWVTFSICADRRSPPMMRIKYTVPWVSQDTSFAREDLIDWMNEFRETIAATMLVLPSVDGIDECVLKDWRVIRAIAEVAGGHWPGTVERLMRRAKS